MLKKILVANNAGWALPANAVNMYMMSATEISQVGKNT